MPATHNIVIGEEYGQEGNTKTKWTTIGVIIENEKDGKKRRSVKLNFIPTGWDGYASVFPIDRDRDNKRQDNRRDATDEDQSTSHDDINQTDKRTDEVVIEDIDDKPIDLSEIPF